MILICYYVQVIRWIEWQYIVLVLGLHLTIPQAYLLLSVGIPSLNCVRVFALSFMSESFCQKESVKLRKVKSCISDNTLKREGVSDLKDSPLEFITDFRGNQIRFLYKQRLLFVVASFVKLLETIL